MGEPFLRFFDRSQSKCDGSPIASVQTDNEVGAACRAAPGTAGQPKFAVHFPVRQRSPRPPSLPPPARHRLRYKGFDWLPHPQKTLPEIAHEVFSSLSCSARCCCSPPATAADLKVGDAAPDFTMTGSDGKTYKLSELNKQGKAVIVAWFPRAFTGRLHEGMHFLQE